jgi:MerR family transcriptional regulator/heat shock protein HspR
MVKSRKSQPDRDRPLYMISVAAELSGMHPQTLRVYERKALISPQRSPGGTRLYSESDVERLRLIQQLTQEDGVNLAGVMRIIQLEMEMERIGVELQAMKELASDTERRIAEEVRKVRESYRAEIVLIPRGRMAKREE